MPIGPILWVIAAAIGLGGIVVALNWEEVVIALKGKKVAVLGQRAVGKTHLIQFLSSGSIPAEYKQTTKPEKASSRRFELKDLSLNLKETKDLPGSKDNYRDWKELHDQADIIFYLLRADRLSARDTEVEALVEQDFKHICEWLKARAHGPPFFIIGTHCDLDPEFAGISPERRGDYRDRFMSLPAVKRLVLRGSAAGPAPRLVLGSMKTLEGTEALVYDVFQQVPT